MHNGQEDIDRDISDRVLDSKAEKPEPVTALKWYKETNGLTKHQVEQTLRKVAFNAGKAAVKDLHEKQRLKEAEESVFDMAYARRQAKMRARQQPPNAIGQPTELYGLPPGQHAGPLHLLGHAHISPPANGWMFHDETQVLFRCQSHILYANQTNFDAQRRFALRWNE